MPNKNNRFWQFKAIANSNEAELMLYGAISEYSWWDDEVTPKKFANDLKEIGNVDKITIRINSPGGDLFAAQAIYSMLKSHSAEIVVKIDGLAASAATVIAMAGDSIIMPENAMMMIHNPLTLAYGNAHDFRKIADDLDKARESMLAVYLMKATIDKDEVIELLDAETWLTATEALEYGFIDSLDDSTQIAATLKNDSNYLVINGLEFDISNYQNRPIIKTITQKGTDKPMPQNILSVEAFKSDYPKLYEQIKNEAYAEGVNAERKRFTDLKELDAPGCEEIVNKARYETGQTATEISMEVIKALKTERTDVVKALIEDADTLNTVESTPTPDTSDETEQRKNVVSNMVKGVNKKRGAK